MKSLIFPKAIFETYFGKTTRTYQASCDLVEFIKCLHALKSKEHILSVNENEFEIDVSGRVSMMSSAHTIFRGICESGSEGLVIKGRFEYVPSARIAISLFLSLIVFIAFSQGEVVFGVFVMYFLVQVLGLTMTIIDCMMNGRREAAILSLLCRCSNVSHPVNDKVQD